MSSATSNSTEIAVERIIDAFEALSPQRVKLLCDIYAGQARFKDPFNDVQGLGEIQRIFSHMYVALDSPRFVVTNKVVDKGQCFLTWEFRFRFRNFQ